MADRRWLGEGGGEDGVSSKPTSGEAMEEAMCGETIPQGEESE
jgi:hypothetical protein